MHTPPLRFAAVLFALFQASALRANDDDSDASGQIRVDVVVDMTEAGHKIARPTPERPAYYLPISVGYKTFGYTHNFQRPPPNEWDIQHALAIALYNQGYRLMTRQGHPSLVLVFWWGYMAPEEEDVNSNSYLTSLPGAFSSGGGTFGGAESSTYWGAGSAGNGGSGGHTGNFLGGSGTYLPGALPPGGVPDATYNAFPQFGIGFQNVNEEQMLSMVAGQTIDDHQKYPDPRLDDVIQMTSAPRYYILVSAFDFQPWLHHKPVLLWRAHVSTELWGHYFDQVAGALINSAGPWFGRETRVPHFIGAEVTPLGRVVVGTPVVKDYPGTPAEEKNP